MPDNSITTITVTEFNSGIRIVGPLVILKLGTPLAHHAVAALAQFVEFSDPELSLELWQMLQRHK